MATESNKSSDVLELEKEFEYLSKLIGNHQSNTTHQVKLRVNKNHVASHPTSSSKHRTWSAAQQQFISGETQGMYLQNISKPQHTRAYVSQQYKLIKNNTIMTGSVSNARTGVAMDDSVSKTMPRTESCYSVRNTNERIIQISKKATSTSQRSTNSTNFIQNSYISTIQSDTPPQDGSHYTYTASTHNPSTSQTKLSKASSGSRVVLKPGQVAPISESVARKVAPHNTSTPSDSGRTVAAHKSSTLTEFVSGKRVVHKPGASGPKTVTSQNVQLGSQHSKISSETKVMVMDSIIKTNPAVSSMSGRSEVKKRTVLEPGTKSLSAGSEVSKPLIANYAKTSPDALGQKSESNSAVIRLVKPPSSIKTKSSTPISESNFVSSIAGTHGSRRTVVPPKIAKDPVTKSAGFVSDKSGTSQKILTKPTQPVRASSGISQDPSLSHKYLSSPVDMISKSRYKLVRTPTKQDIETNRAELKSSALFTPPVVKRRRVARHHSAPGGMQNVPSTSTPIVREPKNKYKFVKSPGAIQKNKYDFVKSPGVSRKNKYKLVKSPGFNTKNKFKLFKSPGSSLKTKYKLIRSSESMQKDEFKPVRSPGSNQKSSKLCTMNPGQFQWRRKSLSNQSEQSMPSPICSMSTMNIKQNSRYKLVKKAIEISHKRKHDEIYSATKDKIKDRFRYTADGRVKKWSKIRSKSFDKGKEWTRKYSLKRNNTDGSSMPRFMTINQILGRKVENLSQSKFKFINASNRHKHNAGRQRTAHRNLRKVDHRPGIQQGTYLRTYNKQSSNGKLVRNHIATRRSRFVLRRSSGIICPTTVKRIINRATKVDRTRGIASRVLQKSIHTAHLARFKKVNNKPGRTFCLYYNRFGKCNRGAKCQYVHDPDRVAICTRFLRGTCDVTNCAFSHKVSKEKMPACRYFIRGVCTKDNCLYLHSNVSKDAKICEDFIQGFCPRGDKCKQKHSLICPDFKKDGECPRGKRCGLRHMKKSDVRIKPKVAAHSDTFAAETEGYDEAEDEDDITLPMSERTLPSYIALDNTLDTSNINTSQISISDGTSLHIHPRLSLEGDNSDTLESPK